MEASTQTPGTLAVVSPLALHSYQSPDYATYKRTDLSDYLSVLQSFSSDILFGPLHSLNKVLLGSPVLHLGPPVQPPSRVPLFDTYLLANNHRLHSSLLLPEYSSSQILPMTP